ncbi:hypothetical protein [Thiohalorhabdus methylotrophus]|uniref:EfeO-type cupredoxin-like domain-containing protein n=1 Tax=Thiohalorhabdus methylotrophus TaxID=3242694 RepID=A0ABV4TWF2_9GAMM
MRRFTALLGMALAVLLTTTTAQAGKPETVDGVTVIHLDEYNGYFAAEDTLGGLQPGRYKFVVTNKAPKVVGFQVQHMESHETLAKFPLKPGHTKSATVRVGEAGVRYRCPINPTPWYNLDNITTD